MTTIRAARTRLTNCRCHVGEASGFQSAGFFLERSSSGDEIRRHVGRRHRAHPQRRRHVKREIDAGHRGRGRRLGDGGQDQRARRLVQGGRRSLHDAREYDSVVASGEQVTAGLLAIVLKDMGVKARSWLGWQIPILTDDAHGSARIADDRRRRDSSSASAHGRGRRSSPASRALHRTTGVTTLGRGGSDTTAVALAAAIEADRCDIYTDVDGVYTTDPRIVPKARRLDKVAFEEMLEMASLGAKVLQVRSVELAMVHKVRDLRALVVRRSGAIADRLDTGPAR